MGDGVERVRRGVAVLDCGRKVVTVTDAGGEWVGDWSGAFSREMALDLLARACWREAPGEDWVVAPADNGYRLEVIHDPVSTAVRRGL